MKLGQFGKKDIISSTSPDRVNEANVQKHLTTKKYGQHIHYFETCKSTQFIAHDEEQNGAPDGTVVISEEQTAGRGRMARPWSSTAGKGFG